jgi:hypothetical protein
MSFRYTSRTLLGAAALVAISASLVAAQSTGVPKSTRRIPISKEAPGEVVRVDTVTLYKTDTLRLTEQLPGRVDTVRNTVIRIDTVVPPPLPVRLPNGLYFGLAGGVSAPNGALYNTNSAGPSFQAQVGWQGAKNLLGVRADVNYAQPGEDGRFSSLQGNPDILNFSADAKLQLPFLTHLMGASHRFALYGIGGYTHTMYKSLPIRLEGQTASGDIIVAPGEADWKHFNGWNAGGGASLGWGRTELFLESRLLSFKPDNAPQARQIPFMFGINFY